MIAQLIEQRSLKSKDVGLNPTQVSKREMNMDHDIRLDRVVEYDNSEKQYYFVSASGVSLSLSEADVRRIYALIDKEIFEPERQAALDTL